MTARPARRKDNTVPKKWKIDIVVAEGFVLIEVAGIVDVIRIANRVCPQPPFQWAYRSLDGGVVRSRSDAFVETTPIPTQPDADYVFVIGNSDPDNPALSLTRVISGYTYRGAQVFLLAEAASRYIKDKGAQDHATHWENASFLSERGSGFVAKYSIATEHGPVVTCAGMGSTVDIALALIGRHVSGAAKMTVANVMLHEHIRDFGSMQPYSGVRTSETGDSKLDQALEIMQANIEEPVPINEIVAALDLSNRSLERKFRTYLGATPNGYYRELRLAKANNLLLNTTMSIHEIGLACGFPNGFSAVYKSVFGITPFAMRSKRRAGGAG